MKKVGKNSIIFDDVYLLSTGTCCGYKEHLGPLGSYFDKYYKDPYCDEKSFEQGEIKLLKDAMQIALAKVSYSQNMIDCYVGGDLNNQITVTSYMLKDFNIPYLGVYSACSTLTESIIVSSLLLSSGFGENILFGSSSHNETSERQFRNPTEYGGQKSNTLTSTATGAGCGILSKKVTDVKVTKATIGVPVESPIKDASDMGRAMAPAAADTLRHFLDDFKMDVDELDLIVTGDLSTYGSISFLKILNGFGINLKDNYRDSGLLLYDTKKQNVYAGGSGAGCVTLVTLGYLNKLLLEGKIKKVLIIATGALLNPIMVAQKLNIPSIAHAVMLEGGIR